MKILLIGEYNSSHYTLKQGLQQLGHQVVVIGNGDGFKNRKVDINFKIKYRTGLINYLRRLIYKLTSLDITSLSVQRQFNKHKHLFKNYDVVQLINENAFNCFPKVEKQLLQFIFDHNKNVFLLSCGTDYMSVKYAADRKFRYDILTPYYEGKGTKHQFWHALMYLEPSFVDLHKFVYKNIKGVIASDFDYDIPLKGHEKYLGLAPNPINIDALPYSDMQIDGKIVIFHGINEQNYFKKGNDIFEAALEIIKLKYPEKVEIITVRSLPYEEYIKSFDKAHILLDQVFAYDQGFNALEAMAKGKVVFTGAEQEWLDYYNLKEDTVAINALPDAESIAYKLEWLIKHPEKILEISKNARSFIEKEHHYVDCAKIYLEKWTSRI